MEEVSVFRLRGVASREEALRTVFAMSVEAFDAGLANKAQVEEGVDGTQANLDVAVVVGADRE
jgi:hypothetical protein